MIVTDRLDDFSNLRDAVRISRVGFESDDLGTTKR